MTEEEQVQLQDHLRSIRYFSSSSMRWEGSKIVSKIQEELDAVKRLLQEPEPEEVSITKLVIRCTQLEMENHGLIQDLKTDEAYVKMLREQIGTLQVTVAKTKALLKAANQKLAQFRIGWCPYDCATVEELAKLRAEIEYQNKLLRKANEKLASREACLRSVRADLDQLMKRAWM